MVTKTANRANVSAATGDEGIAPKPQHDKVSAVKSIKSGADLLALAVPSNRLLEKQKLLTGVSQTLAEVTDLQSEEGQHADRIGELSQNAAFNLWQGMLNGVVTLEDVTQTLGDIFGWRKKGDAKVRAERVADQSKTPFGYGETIRKRIVRGVRAYQFGRTGEINDRFFEPLDQATVSEIMADVETGDISLFTAYDQLQDERRENAPDPVNPVFDPVKVLKSVQTLSEKGAVDQFADNPALLVAYASMTETINAITSALMEREDAETIIEAVRTAQIAAA
jgi:hypothetical protein